MGDIVPRGADNGRQIKNKILIGTLQVLIPLYITYILFALSVFLIFIPKQKSHLLDQKKETIRQLTDSTISLLEEFHQRVLEKDLPLESAQHQAISQVRTLRYGPEGKDYFWINDTHPFMIMHPYRPDLEKTDLTLFRDKAGNYPFVAMVETVLRDESGYVNYFWQWKDTPEKVVPKISYVCLFKPWNWIVGTGIYLEDIHVEIREISRNFILIFLGIFVFILLLSAFIARQVFRIEQGRHLAEEARRLEELRLEKLFELSQMTSRTTHALTEFALEEAIHLTKSQIGYLAFMNEAETQLTMYTWSRQTMKECEIENKLLIYTVKDTGLWAEAARTRKAEIINDYASYPRDLKKGYPEGHVEITRVMNIPVFDGEQIVALAGVGNKEEPYNDSDVRQLQLMMDGMWKIIQKKRAEDNLKDSEARYRLLAENASDVIWIMALSTLRFTYVSPAMENLLGYSVEEVMQLEMDARLTTGSRERVTHLISNELSQEGQEGIDPDRYRVLEIEMIKKDGSIIWTEVTARFLRDPNGVPDRILGITRDISHRKELERKLRNSNTDLRLAQQIAGVGSWTMDPLTDKREWSDEVYRILGLDPGNDPASWNYLQSILDPPWWEKYQQAIQKASHQGEPYDIELKFNLTTSRVRWVHVICEPEPHPNGEGYFLRGIIQDITERKLFEHRVQQSQKMEALGTLAGGIAHDFNNILSSILGFAELARLGVPPNADMKKHLDSILTAGLRARDLVKHILAFSRRADLQKTRIPIVPLVKESLKFIRASVGPEIDIHMAFNSKDSLVLADSSQMHQVMMNLFTNAAYAMKEKGGILDVKQDAIVILDGDITQAKEIQPGRYVELIIADTGCGIPKSVKDKIFEPFFTTKPRGEGTGMGLSQVYGIIKEMKGDISVYSETGQGTTFKLLIPEQKPETSSMDEVIPEVMVTGKGRLMVVDDEPSIVDWCTQVLIKLGYQVEGFHYSRDALERFKHSPKDFDLVLTDLAMPDMSGLELSMEFRKCSPHIPIVVCTGFSEGLTREKLHIYGISNMVMKPLIASELSRVINSAINEFNPQEIDDDNGPGH